MQFVATNCAICDSPGSSKKVFDQNLGGDTFSTKVFSARRIPDRLSYQWVRCLTCGLLRSDPVLSVDLATLYRQSTFDYSSEINGLKRTYGSIIKRALKPTPPLGGILEIGGGNGFFLEIAKTLGFTKVVGVEPSVDAVSAAREDIRPFMIVEMFNADSVQPQSFDVVAMFHVLDHLSDPLTTISLCRSALVPQGTFVAAVHNSESWSARLLKERSPIVDVEHTYLFDANTAKKLLERGGFVDIRIAKYWNHYSLAYLIHLAPLPRKIKVLCLSGKFGRLLKMIKVWVPLGNMWVSGKRFD